MNPFSKPLVALSLTEPDVGLLQYAAHLARVFQWTDVHFAHVVPERRGHQSWNPDATLATLREEVNRGFGEPAPNSRSCFHAVPGSRIDQLVALSVDHERDLVLLGHRRMRSGRRSLARRLAMVSPCSVLLVPEGSRAGIRGILAPIDFSDDSADALSVAASIAQANHLKHVEALHVFFDSSTIRYDEHVEDVLGQERAAFEKFVRKIDTKGICVEPIFHESTHPAEAILRVAERHESDLIVIATRGRSHAASVLLGSTTSETMAASKLPVLAVKHHGRRMTLLDVLRSHRFWEKKVPKTN